MLSKLAINLLKYINIRKLWKLSMHRSTNGDPDRIRTCDLLLRRQLLYPAELRDRIKDANIKCTREAPKASFFIYLSSHYKRINHRTLLIRTAYKIINIIKRLNTTIVFWINNIIPIMLLGECNSTLNRRKV